MNIVFTGTFALSPKGTMKARALPLAQALVRRGHRVTMVLPPWDNPGDAGTALEVGGVPIINLRLPPRAPLAWYGLLAWRLLKAVEALRPDVVHAFKPKGFSGLVAQALLARRQAGRLPSELRVVVDTDDWEGSGGWNDLESYSWWQRAVFAYQEPWLLRHADAVTVASRTLEQMALERRPDAHRGVYYVPNGTAGPPSEPTEETICLPEATLVARLRAELGLGDGPILLLYTRFVEFSPRRAVELLYAIAQGGERPTLLLVGKGLHEEEQDFLRLARTSGLALPTVNAGWVQEEELPAYLALADAALFPMDDTLVNQAKCSAKLVDLLSAGVPVVAEAVGQCREYIQHQSTGWLVPPGDTQAFASAVIALLRDRPLRQRLGSAARAHMAAAYTWDRLAATAEAAYLP